MLRRVKRLVLFAVFAACGPAVEPFDAGTVPKTTYAVETLDLNTTVPDPDSR